MYCQYEEELFDSYVNTERHELSRGLGGEENMNFTYVDAAAGKEKALDAKLKDAVEFLLRDVMCETYMKTFDKVKCDYVVPEPDKDEAMHCLIKVALILTRNVIA